MRSHQMDEFKAFLRIIHDNFIVFQISFEVIILGIKSFIAAIHQNLFIKSGFFGHAESLQIKRCISKSY